MNSGFVCSMLIAGVWMFTSLGASSTVHAATLLPGESALLSGTTAASQPEIAGTILDQRVADFSVLIRGQNVTGAVSQRVRRFQGFGVLIDYRITSFDDQGLGLEIQGLNTQDFFAAGLLGPLEADFRLDESGDVAPVTASLQSGFGSPVTFDFGFNALSTGDTTRWMFVGDPNNDLVVFGGFGAHLLVSDPAGPSTTIPFSSYLSFIPSPSTLPLLAWSLAGLGIARYRKRSHCE